MIEVNPIERSILTVLLKTRKFMTTSAIAKRAGISWNTADKYLTEFHQREWVVMKGRIKKYWKAIVRDENEE